MCWRFGEVRSRLLCLAAHGRGGSAAAVDTTCLLPGNTPYLLRHVPSVALSFALKDALRRRLPEVDAHERPLAALAVNSAAGGLAGAAALMLVYPFEVTAVPV